MKKPIKTIFICFLALLFVVSCDREYIIEVSDSFDLKVSSSIKTNLLNFYKDARLKKGTNEDLINKYSKDYMPVDSSLRALLKLRVSNLEIKKSLEEFGCIFKNGNSVDLYYWIPILSIMEIVELEYLLSINSKGIIKTR
ncbi:MAG: hypothetical protein JEY94_07245 [Melioribacteraceae bacterium]|nr:hypothetical protein [Melioribacteraceae bacterium]